MQYLQQPSDGAERASRAAAAAAAQRLAGQHSNLSGNDALRKNSESSHSNHSAVVRGTQSPFAKGRNNKHTSAGGYLTDYSVDDAPRQGSTAAGNEIMILDSRFASENKNTNEQPGGQQQQQHSTSRRGKDKNNTSRTVDDDDEDVDADEEEKE